MSNPNRSTQHSSMAWANLPEGPFKEYAKSIAMEIAQIRGSFGGTADAPKTGTNLRQGAGISIATDKSGVSTISNSGVTSISGSGPISMSSHTGSVSIYAAVATAAAVGVASFGTGLSVDVNGLVTNNNPTPYVLPAATASALGGVKVGSGISVAGDGTISVTPYTLPAATSSTLGGVKVSTGLTVAADGTLTNNNPTPYTLPVATGTSLGGVKVGSGISVAGDGTISVTPYTLPMASATVLGGVKVGSGLAIDASGVLSSTASGGTVTSVGLSLPTIFSVTNSPVTSSGTLTATLANQNANLVFAGPGSGAATTPGFRALVAADLPSSITSNTSGTAAGLSATLAIASGGTGATTAAAALSNLGGAPLASPTFTGIPSAPTAVAGTNTTQIATTAFVLGQGFVTGGPYLPLAGGTLSGALVVGQINTDLEVGGTMGTGGTNAVSLRFRNDNTQHAQFRWTGTTIPGDVILEDASSSGAGPINWYGNQVVNFNIRNGALKIAGTTVIDGSHNATLGHTEANNGTNESLIAKNGTGYFLAGYDTGTTQGRIGTYDGGWKDTALWGGNFNVVAGGYKINGSTVIDSSRNGFFGGYAQIGNWPNNPTSNYAFFGNASAGTGNGAYALLQGPGGTGDKDTYLNAMSGGIVHVRNNNADVATFSATAVNFTQPLNMAGNAFLDSSRNFTGGSVTGTQAIFTSESRFSNGTFSDPRSGYGYGIKFSQGIAGDNAYLTGGLTVGGGGSLASTGQILSTGTVYGAYAVDTHHFAAVYATAANLPVYSTIYSSVTGDSQPRFAADGNGKLQWGPGGTTALDTNLYRSAAGMLKTDQSLTVAGTNSSIANPAWTNAALLNSFVNYTANGSNTNYQPTRYMKDATGTVFIEGAVCQNWAGQPASGTIIFTLPSGYAPGIELTTVQHCAGSNYCYVYIDQSGNVIVYTIAGSDLSSSGFLGLTISFKAG